MTLVIFFAVIALAAIAVVNALGVFQALLMGVILALLAFIVIAVPSRPAATSAGKGSPDTAPEGRGMGQVSQVRSLSGVPAHS